jgi:hypothetical protein
VRHTHRWLLLAILATSCSCTRRGIEGGFWFEPVSYESARLGAPITLAEMAVIESVARAELAAAFAGLNITFADNRDARFRVKVVQELRDQRFRRDVRIAGESRAAAGFGGAGAVSFSFLAGGAMVYSPESAGRAAVIEAIGRGVGRAAVHEFAHQLLPHAAIHDTTDAQSYEYASATRPEQYFGGMHWDLAGPLLQDKIGRRAVD